MATPNVGILTTAGKALIDKVNSGQAKISFSKVVFSSMDNSQLSDTQIKALTAISPQEVVVSSPETTLDTNSGETRIRATGTNKKLADGVYVKTYGVFAKDDTGNEILYGVTVSPNPNYFPAYDGVTPQAVTYSYKTVIQETSNITMTNSNDVYVSQEDLTEAIAKIPQPDLSGYDKTDDVDKKLQSKQDKLGYTAANDSAVVHSTDMRKPANDVAGIEEVNAKQNLIGYTPADDSKVAHLSGANSFDTVPTVNNNPLLLASSLPSDLARTSQQTNFTAGLQSGGVDVATAADLKSIEDASWHTITGKNSTFSDYVLMYKINDAEKYVDLIFYGTMGISISADSTMYEAIDLSTIIKNPKDVSGGLIGLEPANGAGEGVAGNVSISGTKVAFNWQYNNGYLPSGTNMMSYGISTKAPLLRVTFY